MTSFHLTKDLRSDTLNSREIYHRSVVSGGVDTAGFIAGTNELVEILVPSTGLMKRDVTTLEDVSDGFSKLKPSRYEIVYHGQAIKRDIGLIAEDVLPLFPEFVEYSSKGCAGSPGKKTVKGFSYDKLVVLCIQQIQQLRVENKSLSDRLNALEKK
jgi:hypothetical protein